MEQSQFLLEFRVNRTLWVVAKIIQAIGLFEVMYGLIIGLKDDNLGMEFRYAGIGLLSFLGLVLFIWVTNRIDARTEAVETP